MVRSLLVILLLCLCMVPSFGQVTCNNVLFLEHPADQRTTVDDTTVSFHCETMGASVNHHWDHYQLNGSRTTITSNRPDLSFFINSSNGDLIIGSVQNMHNGAYACIVFESNDCVFSSNNATLTVEGPPMVSVTPPSPVNTQSTLLIQGTIGGIPVPNLELVKVEADGTQTRVLPATHARFALSLEMTMLTISVDRLEVGDQGVYLIRATNSRGTDSTSFSITAIGPDPPMISVNSAVVSRFDEPVMVNCSVQTSALVGGANVDITWMNPQLIEVTESGGEVFVDNRNVGFAILRISALSSNHTGSYTCMVSNIRGNDISTATVYGPPSRVAGIRIVVGDNGEHIVRWNGPLQRDPPILNYNVYIYRPGENVVRLSAMADSSALMYTIPDSILEGDVDVAAVSGSEGNEVEGTRSERVNFLITPSDDFTTIIAAVAGSVGGVVVLVLVGVAIGVFFLCVYYPHRRKTNSQQRRWDSEEEKVDGVGATVANHYTTALTLNPHSELPPSPNSPMISSIFSTEIDPKWEFPRENIQLSDVLNEGQFTVLYRGSAKGIKEKSLDVAVKSVKDDATEDDVKALVCEMELLSSIGPHPNIVSLVRVCTVGKPIYMVMEYMCHGDLLGFMRASRGHHGMYTVSPGTRYQPPSLTLSSRDLLNIASKIAKGMRFLADRKIVHRALCCKNVLVGAGMDIKIYNVGSFDITFDNRDSLMKWMAPETLFDGTTTTYSDVWSFGVTLWELVTVGGTPYAEIQVEDLYSQLHSGMRMPKPQHCAQEVYNIMRDCWERNPTDRPHLSVIHDQLDALAASKMSFLNLRNYNGYEYSQFEDPVELSTAL